MLHRYGTVHNVCDYAVFDENADTFPDMASGPINQIDVGNTE